MALSSQELNDLRYELSTAAYKCLWYALPFRKGVSEATMQDFSRRTVESRLPRAEMDSILIRYLAVLDRQTGGHLPTLVERYVRETAAVVPPDRQLVFQRLLGDVVRYCGIGDRVVEQAIAIIETEFRSPLLKQDDITRRLDVSPSNFSSRFKKATGQRFEERRRDLRLDEAARLLSEGQPRIKDVWTAVGFNDLSNFDHQFKARFGMTPREFRARGVVTLPPGDWLPPTPQRDPAAGLHRSPIDVLVVDDDESTRLTISRWLRLEGFAVRASPSGKQALDEVGRAMPDSILLDYRMPLMDGLETLRRIRATEGGARPGIALLTVDPDVYEYEDAVKAFDAVIATKLCELEQIEQLAAFLAPVA